LLYRAKINLQPTVIGLRAPFAVISDVAIHGFSRILRGVTRTVSRCCQTGNPAVISDKMRVNTNKDPLIRAINFPLPARSSEPSIIPAPFLTWIIARFNLWAYLKAVLRILIVKWLIIAIIGMSCRGSANHNLIHNVWNDAWWLLIKPYDLIVI
jgi:hypothetical protein